VLSGERPINVSTTLQMGCWGFLELHLPPTKQVVGLVATHNDLLSEEQQRLDWEHTLAQLSSTV